VASLTKLLAHDGNEFNGHSELNWISFLNCTKTKYALTVPVKGILFDITELVVPQAKPDENS